MASHGSAAAHDIGATSPRSLGERGFFFYTALTMKTTKALVQTQRHVSSGLDADFHDLYTDNMLFQREAPVPVSGFGVPGTRLRISLGSEQRQLKVSREGLWNTRFRARAACEEGTSLTLAIKTGKNEYQTLRSLENIVFGELWICSGQSNMEMGLGMAEGGKETALDATDPLLRFLLIEKSSSPIPRMSLPHPWQVSNPETVLANGWEGFSAAAWWFGRRIRREVGVPVGLIQAAYGGAKIHPFIKGESPLGGISGSCRRELNLYLQELRIADQKYQLALGQCKLPAINEEDAISLHPLKDHNEYNSLSMGSAWHAMLSPLGALPARGILWYQGESDADNPAVYPDKMRLLSRQFRRNFGAKHFFFVQIAPWTYGSPDTLPLFWEAQARHAEKSGQGMVGTVDIGDMDDIHPVKKREVGERLAALALRDCYGNKNNGAGSPVYWRSSRGEESISIEFRAMNNKFLDGLEARGNKGFPLGFVGTWRDGHSEELKGRVDGNGVLLDCPDAKELAGLSYAFKQEAGGNLFNGHGEPAIPFRIQF